MVKFIRHILLIAAFIGAAVATGQVVESGGKSYLRVIQGPGTVPTGVVMPFAGTTPPDGWLFAAGQAVSRTTYATLFAAIGTTYGAGDGSTTFNLPDVRGRAVAGRDDMNGTAANRLTNGGSGINGVNLGAAGGTETHILTPAQLASHQHTMTHGHADTIAAANENAHTHSYSGTTSAGADISTGLLGVVSEPGGTFGSWDGHAIHRGGTLSATTPDGSYPGQTHTHTYSGSTGAGSSHTHTITGAVTDFTGSTVAAGSGNAHQNTPPTLILNYIIKI